MNIKLVALIAMGTGRIVWWNKLLDPICKLQHLHLFHIKFKQENALSDRTNFSIQSANSSILTFSTSGSNKKRPKDLPSLVVVDMAQVLVWATHGEDLVTQPRLANRWCQIKKRDARD